MTKNNRAGWFLAGLWLGLGIPLSAMAGEASGARVAPEQRAVSGKVVEALKAGQYTYLCLDDGKEKVWVATYAAFKVAVGDEVRVGDYMVMEKFRSKTLDRTFDAVLFTGQIQVAGQTNANALELPPGHPKIQTGAGTKPSDAKLPPGHPAIGPGKSQVSTVTVEKGSIKKIRGGYTVEECFDKRKQLAQKTIKVRGVVVKAAPSIMNRNWIHIQDGTGQVGANDLTVTTQETAEVGELVVVAGKLSYDRDFGAGYAYPVVLEEASVDREGMYRR